MLKNSSTRSRRIGIASLWFALVAPPAWAGPLETSEACQLALQSEQNQLGGEIRARVIAASNRYAQLKPQRAISMFRGEEYRLLSPAHTSHSPVAYIGAGADVFRPIVDYPLTDEYHFLDSLQGWGQSPVHLIASIVDRLSFLAADVAVETEGFLKNYDSVLKPNLMDHGNPVSNLLSYLSLVEAPSEHVSVTPLVIRFTLPLHVGGVEKRIFIHPYDIASHEDHVRFLAHLGGRRLAGVLQAGLSGTPHAEDLKLLLEALEPTGWYLKEFAGREFNQSEWEQPGQPEAALGEFGHFLAAPTTGQMTPIYYANGRGYENHPLAGIVLFVRLSNP